MRRHVSECFAQNDPRQVEAFLKSVLEGLRRVGGSPTGGALLGLVQGCLVDVDRSLCWPLVVEFLRVLTAEKEVGQVAAIVGTLSVAPLPLELALDIVNDVSGMVMERFADAAAADAKRLLRSMARVFRSLGYRHGEVDQGVVKAWRDVADSCLTCAAPWEVYEGASQLLLEMGNISGWAYDRSFNALVGVLTRVELREAVRQDVDVDTADVCSLESLCTNGLLAMASMPIRCLTPVADVVRLAVRLSVVTPRVVALLEEEPNAFVVEMDGLCEDYLLVRHAAVRIMEDLVEAGNAETVASVLAELARNARDVVEMEAALSSIVKMLMDWDVDADSSAMVEAAQVLTKRLLRSDGVMLYTALYAAVQVEGSLQDALKVSLELLSRGSSSQHGSVSTALVLMSSRVVQLCVERGVLGADKRTVLPQMVGLMDQTNEDTVHIILESIKAAIRCYGGVASVSERLVPKLEDAWESGGHDPFIRDEVVEIYVVMIQDNAAQALPFLQRYLQRSVKAITLYRLVRDQAHPSLLHGFARQFAKDLCTLLQNMPQRFLEPDVLEDVAGAFMDHTAMLEDINAMVQAAMPFIQVIPDGGVRQEVMKHVAETCAHRSNLAALQVFATHAAQHGAVSREAFASAFARTIVLLNSGEFLDKSLVMQVASELLDINGRLSNHLFHSYLG